MVYFGRKTLANADLSGEVLAGFDDAKLRNSAEMEKRQRSAAGLIRDARNVQATQIVSDEQKILNGFLAESQRAQDRIENAIRQMTKAEGDLEVGQGRLKQEAPSTLHPPTKRRWRTRWWFFPHPGDH